MEILLTKIAASANTHLSAAQASQLIAIYSDNLHFSAAMYAKRREAQPVR